MAVGTDHGAGEFWQTITLNPPTWRTANQAAAVTAVILMRNWIMSMTRTPQRPEYMAKTTLRKPQASRVCQRGSPKRMLAILQAARLTVAMMTQLKKRPR